MNHIRRRMKTKTHSFRCSYTICKAVFLITILDGLGGRTSFMNVGQLEGANGRQNLHSEWINGHGSSTFDVGSSPGEGVIRMNERCLRFSLLVFQQWGSLQKRCGLNLGSSKKKRQRGHFDHTMLENSLPRISENDDKSIRKRVEDNGIAGLANENNRHRNYYYELNGDALESCCPVVFEVIAPIYGRNRSGHMVELYKDENVQQKFYEYRCHKDYVEQPCRYVNNQHRKISKCMQQYLDTYALVRSDTSLTGWSMEHIRIASGCACKVDRLKTSRRRKKVSSSLNLQRNSHNIFRKHSYRDVADSKRHRYFDQLESSSRSKY